MGVILRDYQQDVFDKTRDAFRMGFKAPLVVLPCRSRKKLCNEGYD